MALSLCRIAFYLPDNIGGKKPRVKVKASLFKSAFKKEKTVLEFKAVLVNILFLYDVADS